MSIEVNDEDYNGTWLFTGDPSNEIVIQVLHLLTDIIDKNFIIKQESVESATLLRRFKLEVFNYRSSNFIINIFATILEDALIKLCLLDQCNNSLCIYTKQSEFKELHREKYGVIIEKNDNGLGSLELKNFGLADLKLDKLFADRTSCKDLLTSTYVQLALESNFIPLVKWRLEAEQREADYNLLVEEEIRNRNTRRELARALRQQRNRFKSAVYEYNVILTQLRNQVEDATVLAETRERYIDKWAKARQEQHTCHIEDNESSSSKARLCYRQKIDGEQRVHNEIDVFNHLRLNELLHDLEMSIAKFDKDIEEIELKIQIKKFDYETQMEVRREMERKLADRRESINKWIEFKLERESVRQYKIKMTNAATTVQAWWRGLLVRLALGPYQQKKKLSKKKK